MRQRGQALQVVASRQSEIVVRSRTLCEQDRGIVQRVSKVKPPMRMGADLRGGSAPRTLGRHGSGYAEDIKGMGMREFR